MRSLTITRRKTGVACLGKVQIYVEDQDQCDLNIQGTPCRLLGTLKNGETDTYEIPDYEVKVFAIFGKASRGYCCDYFTVPEGGDVELSGRPHFNPITGNAFRFDGAPEPDVVAFRRACFTKGLVTNLLTTVLAFVAGFAIVYFMLIK